MKTMTEIQKVLNKIRTHEDLVKFRKEEREKFCKKHDILSGQFDFLLAIVAAERIKDKNII
jgi:hypothetical protein